MTHQYFALSQNANLNENESIWISDSNWIKIPHGQLEELFLVFACSHKHSANILQKVFVDFDEEFQIKIEDDYYIDASLKIKNQWIKHLESILFFILHSKEEIHNFFINPPELVYDNKEYALMIKALIQLVNESIRLNEPIDKWLAY